MNAERLHLVASAVSEELASLDLVGRVGALVSGLESLVANPSDAGAQEQISEARTQLATLADAPSNSWPPTDRQALDDLGLSDVLGASLLERVEGILARNDITPSVAVGELGPIRDRLGEVREHLSQLLAGMLFFGVTQDELVDDSEVGVAIPRSAVDSNLPQLGAELVRLQRILGPFEELAGEGRADFKVRAIASSDFSIFLAASSSSVFIIARAVKEIVETYDKILDIKRKRMELADLVPEETLAGVDTHANTVMGDRIDELTNELVDATNLDEGRMNELKIEVRMSLNQLANRIDGGYSIDIRTPPPSDEFEGDEGQEDTATSTENARLRAIRELAVTIRRLETPNTRILRLPEPPDEGVATGDSTE